MVGILFPVRTTEKNTNINNAERIIIKLFLLLDLKYIGNKKTRRC